MDIFLTMDGVTIGQAETGFCANTANIWQIIGYFLMVFKIAIPVLLILFGMIDLGKAVVASKDDEIKKATKGLVMRAIAAIVVFLIPTIIGFIFNIIGGFTAVSEDYEICKACLTSPGGGTCDGKAEGIWTSEAQD